jgi:hypothetical protein
LPSWLLLRRPHHHPSVASSTHKKNSKREGLTGKP